MNFAFLIGYFFVVNAAAFFYFRLDKRRAVSGDWRVSEQFLLVLALAGGWIGAKLAQKRFRHKTRKQPFATILNMVPACWGAILIVIALAGSLAHAPVGLSSLFAADAPPERPAPRFFQSVGR